MEVSILPGRERRRKWNAEEKLRIIERNRKPGKRAADVARSTACTRTSVMVGGARLWQTVSRNRRAAALFGGSRFG
jgi:transposase-like protein